MAAVMAIGLGGLLAAIGAVRLSGANPSLAFARARFSWLAGSGLRAVGSRGLGRILALCAPALVFAIGSAASGAPAAAVGTALGLLTATTFLAALLIASEAPERGSGAHGYAMALVFAAVVLFAVAFDGRIGSGEGVAMLACAGLVAWRLPPVASALHDRPGSGRAWLWVGAGSVAVLGGAWLAIFGARTLMIGRPDGDLMAGLCGLGPAAAAPLIWRAWRGRESGEGGTAFREIVAALALCLFAMLGLAALVRPLPVPDSFLRAPLIGLSLSAAVMLWLTIGRRPVPRSAPAVGLIVYLALFVAYLKVAA